MSFFAPFKNFLLDFMEDGSQDQAVRWGTISTRFEDIALLSRQITTKSNLSNTTQINMKNGLHQLVEGLNEINPILQNKKIIFGKDQGTFQHIRNILLELWMRLMFIIKNHHKFKLLKWEQEQKKKKKIKKKSKRKNKDETETPQLSPEEPAPPLPPSVILGSIPNMNDISVMYNTVTLIMVREEFNLQMFVIDKEPKQDIEIRLARRYRSLLFRTQSVAQKTLSAHASRILSFHLKND